MKRILLSIFTLGILFGGLFFSTSFAQSNSCPLPWGGTLASGQSIDGRKIATGTTSQCTAAKKTLTCKNGTIANSSTYKFPACGTQCTLPWDGELGHGKSITGRKISVATITQTCDSAKGILTCKNGDLQGGKDTYVNQSCTQKTWGNCTSPKPGIHLDYFDFYKIANSTWNQTCAESKSRFQCIDGKWTGAYPIASYQSLTCTQDSYKDCRHPITKELIKNNTKIVGYTTGSAATCTKIELTCNNSKWEGLNESSFKVLSCTPIATPPTTTTTVTTCELPWGGTLGSGLSTFGYKKSVGTVTECESVKGKLTCIGGKIQGNTGSAYINPACGTQCTLPWDKTLDHGKSITGRKISVATITQTCDSAKGILTCKNGDLQGGKDTYVNQSCTQKTWGNCTYPKNGIHLDYFDFYKISNSTWNQTCAESKSRFQCINGTWTGAYPIASYQSLTCTQDSYKDCRHPITKELIKNNTKIVGYTTGSAATCTKIELTCNNSKWEGLNESSFKVLSCTPIATPPTTTTCELPWGGTLGSGLSTFGYKKSVGTVTECESVKGKLTCIGGKIQGNTGSVYINPACGTQCTLPWGGTLNHGKTITGRKISEATITQTCDSVKGTLTCNNGDLQGGKNIYTNPECIETTFVGCKFGDTTKNHLDYADFYKISNSTYDKTCAENKSRFQCIDGTWTGAYPIASYQSLTCTQDSYVDCKTPWNNLLIENNKKIKGYIRDQSTQNATGSCSSGQVEITCNNGTWTSATLGGQPWVGNTGDLKGECEELGCYVNSKYFYNGRTGLYFSASTPPNGNICTNISSQLSCTNGKFSGNLFQYPFQNCGKTYNPCIIDKPIGDKRKNPDNFDIKTGKIIIPNGWTGKYFSEIVSPYPKLCSDIAAEFVCKDGQFGNNAGIFIGDFNQYPYNNCDNGKPLNCSFTGKYGTITFNHNGTGKYYPVFSSPLVTFPKTCEDVSTKLGCNNGVILGNWQSFSYEDCEQTGGLVTGYDLRLDVKFLGNNTGFAQYSAPAINVFIKNRGTKLINGSNIAPGFLTCIWHIGKADIVNTPRNGSSPSTENTLVIYKSRILNQLIINPGTSLKKTILLNDLFTQSLGDKVISCKLEKRVSGPDTEENIANNNWTGKVAVITAERFDISMNRAIDSIKDNLDAPEILSESSVTAGADAIKDFLFKKIMNVVVPLVITAGIFIAIVGFYKILFSSDEKAIGDGVKYIMYGVIGIIIIMSAKYLSTTIYSDLFNSGEYSYTEGLKGYLLAQNIYEKVAFPFIKLAIYLSLGVLFVILASRVVSFIFASSEDTKKKAGTIIAWNTVGMIVIIGSKQVVEFIYGKWDKVVKPVSNLGEIGSGILADKSFPLLYQIINWIMGLSALVILVMVLIQAFQLLLKPDNPDAMKKIKNTLLYIFIGIIIIGTGYIITNFLIIN